jgi:hypothetical protein
MGGRTLVRGPDPDQPEHADPAEILTDDQLTEVLRMKAALSRSKASGE